MGLGEYRRQVCRMYTSSTIPLCTLFCPLIFFRRLSSLLPTFCRPCNSSSSMRRVKPTEWPPNPLMLASSSLLFASLLIYLDLLRSIPLGISTHQIFNVTGTDTWSLRLHLLRSWFGSLYSVDIFAVPLCLCSSSFSFSELIL